MKRTAFDSMPCPVAQALERIGEWWTLLILREAFLGTRNFGAFQQALGIARNVLSTRLRRLVEQGILERRVSPADAREVEYRLTPKGLDLLPVLLALAQWGDRWVYEGKAPTRFRNRHTGAALLPLRPRDEQGTELAARDLELVRPEPISSETARHSSTAAGAMASAPPRRR